MLLVALNRSPPSPTLFPYTTLFRSQLQDHRYLALGCGDRACRATRDGHACDAGTDAGTRRASLPGRRRGGVCLLRSEEHTSELQSQSNLVCRLLLVKKKNYKYSTAY